jgi:hypothetical protein
MKVSVTQHARIRIRERWGISRRSVVDKLVRKAYNTGIKHCETTGSLKHFLSRLYFHSKKANNMRIYQGRIFIFFDAKLLTVYNLPEMYMDLYRELEKSLKAIS